MQSIQQMFLAAIISLPTLTLAYYPYEAIQLNFYSDKKCTAYIGEHDITYPYLNADPSFPECFNFAQPSGTVSLNIAGAYGYGTAGSATPAYCELFSGNSCLGSQIIALYCDQGAEDCQPTRSTVGNYLWKSAKCYFGNT